MEHKKIVISGFKPYPGSRGENVTETIPQELYSAYPELITPLTLKATYDAYHEITREFIPEDEAPDAIIMFGQAPGKNVRLEEYAKNRNLSLMPDANYRYKFGRVSKYGPMKLESTLPLVSIEEELHDAGIESVYSESAGSYVCNATFYKVMEKVQQANKDVVAGFIHIPEKMPRYEATIVGRIALARTIDAIDYIKHNK